MKFKKNDQVMFTFCGDESSCQEKRHDGQKARIIGPLREIDPGAYREDIVKQMYRIEFTDGVIGDAFERELGMIEEPSITPYSIYKPGSMIFNTTNELFTIVALNEQKDKAILCKGDYYIGVEGLCFNDWFLQSDFEDDFLSAVNWFKK